VCSHLVAGRQNIKPIFVAAVMLLDVQEAGATVGLFVYVAQDNCVYNVYQCGLRCIICWMHSP
jgi:hypothetical protein